MLEERFPKSQGADILRGGTFVAEELGPGACGPIKAFLKANP